MIFTVDGAFGECPMSRSNDAVKGERQQKYMTSRPSRLLVLVGGLEDFSMEQFGILISADVSICTFQGLVRQLPSCV